MSDGDRCKGKIKQGEGKGAVRLGGLFQMVGSGRAPGIGYLRETWGTRGRRRVTVQAGGTARAKALRWESARGVLGPPEASGASGGGRGVSEATGTCSGGSGSCSGGQGTPCRTLSRLTQESGGERQGAQ